jgi:hypothetical protein
MDMVNVTEPLRPDGMFHHLKMWSEEYALFQNLCNYFRIRVSPTLRAEHPELKKLIKHEILLQHWRRVLLPPLFPSVASQECSLFGQACKLDPAHFVKPAS